ncbi:hypothetical protein GX411_00710 [Candidatus Fermentibacteria bacterium]|nr:hypothetical protein [Candidatus Fermentibacteria bacterium]
MPRGPRLDAPGSYHHVMSRGTGGEEVFRSENDSFNLLLRMHYCLRKTETRVLAWVIMPTHFHLLVQVGEVQLSKVMSRLLTGFCMDYNQIHGRAGHVFMGRFKSILVQDDSYLAELVRYIHLNPVRKGLSTPQRIGAYRWGGHREVMHPVGANGLIDRNGVLALFGDSESVALANYVGFIADGVEQRWRHDFEHGLYLVDRDGMCETKCMPRDDRRYDYSGAVLGSKEFARSVADGMKGRLRSRRSRGTEHEAMKAAAREVAETFDIPLSVLRSRSQRKSAVNARMVLCMVFSRAGISTADAGRFLGLTQQGAWSVLRRCSAGSCPELDEVAASLFERHFNDA